jgi:hypothetical protein
MIKAKITKTDRRHNGHNIMQYIVEADYGGPSDSKDDRIRWFKDMRRQFLENYGPGCELKWVALRPVDDGPNGECRMEPQERWAWDTEFGHMRLYLKSDAEMTFFTLKYLNSRG